jgi:hypothetical protein
MLLNYRDLYSLYCILWLFRGFLKQQQNRFLLKLIKTLMRKYISENIPIAFRPIYTQHNIRLKLSHAITCLQLGCTV